MKSLSNLYVTVGSRTTGPHSLRTALTIQRHYPNARVTGGAR